MILDLFIANKNYEQTKSVLSKIYAKSLLDMISELKQTQSVKSFVILFSKERLWRRAKVGDNILEFGSFDLLRALVKINRK